MGKTYAVADFHGQYILWDKVRNYLQPEDKCYVLGDCIDRGQDGYQILKEVLADKRFIFILGNHEDMMLNYFETNSSIDLRLWLLNGGKTTYEACKNDLDLHDVLQALTLAPVEAIYKNIHLSHAGFAPGVDEDLLWDREHIYIPWGAAEKGIEYIVHGHTPTMYIEEELINSEKYTGVKCDYIDHNGVVGEYCGGHKFCIDGGSAMTHKIGLFDLDELKVAEVFAADEI